MKERSEKLMAAHRRIRLAARAIRAAAFEVADCSAGLPDLEKLAGEVMTMASVTEIVAHAVADAPAS